MESDYDPEIGYTVRFTHIEDSGYYSCTATDNPSHEYQFDVRVEINCESNCSRKIRSIFDEENQITTNISVNINELPLGDGPIMSYDNFTNVTTHSNLKDNELGQRLDRMLNKTIYKTNNPGLCCVFVFVSQIVHVLFCNIILCIKTLKWKCFLHLLF